MAVEALLLCKSYVTYVMPTSSKLLSLYRCFSTLLFESDLVIGEVACRLKLEGLIFPELFEATFEGVQEGPMTILVGNEFH